MKLTLAFLGLCLAASLCASNSFAAAKAAEKACCPATKQTCCPTVKLTCCEKAKAEGKKCTRKCCVAATRSGNVCLKCNPAAAKAKK